MIKLALIDGSNILEWGGAEKYLIQLSNYLKKYFNYEITIISNASSSDEKRMKIEDIKKITVVNLEFYKTIIVPISKDRFPISLKLLKLVKFDIIYNIDVSIFIDLFLLIFSKIFKKKLIRGIHNNCTFNTVPIKNNMIHRILFKIYDPIKVFIIFKYTDIHVLNKDDEKNLQRLGYKGKINLIPNFLFTDSIEKYKSQKNKTFTVLFVGRLSIQQKGLDLLVQIFQKLLKNNNKIKLRIIGSGNDGEKIISNLTKEYPKNIGWVGFLSGKSLDDEYKNADLFILTSRDEAFPLVTLEAQSFGLPVVSFDIKGPRDILTNDIQGRLVKNFSIDEFIIQILYYYNLWFDNYKKYTDTKNMIIKEINSRYSPSIIIPKINKMLKHST